MNDYESQITNPQPTYTLETYNTLPQTFVRPKLSIEDRIAKIENDIADIKQALDMIKWRI